MRILHVSAGNLYGGIETLLVTLARHRDLCPAMEPHFALCFEGRVSGELGATGVPVHLLGEARVRRPLTVWRSRRALASLLRRVSFDAVVCHSAWPQALFGPVVRAAGMPLAFWLHGPARGRHWLERWASLTPPDLAICNSQFTAATVTNIYPQIHAEVIYCPVTPPPALASERRAALRAELDTPENAVVMIQASRFEPLKGHAVLIEALRTLRDLPGWACWIAGDARREDEIRNLRRLKESASRTGIGDRIRWLGERSDVPMLLAAADIYVQPNTRPDAFGIVFVEALYAGLPVVTAPIGGAMEIVDPRCGVLPPADPDAVARALRRLVVDGESRARLGGQGPARARSLCEPTTQINQLAELLQPVTGLERLASTLG
jgi:glycosyltransferase involved in cell wall biosynthesis